MGRACGGGCGAGDIAQTAPDAFVTMTTLACVASWGPADGTTLGIGQGSCVELAGGTSQIVPLDAEHVSNMSPHATAGS